MIIKRVGPVSCAKIAGVVYAGIGLLVGALISIVAVFGAALSGTHRGITDNVLPSAFSAVMGIGAIIVFPILYGLMGFIFALIGAWLYNLVASAIGGIEIDVT